MSICLFRLSANVKIGFQIAICFILTQCECQNRIWNVKIAYFDSVRMPKYDFECQNSLISTQGKCQNRILNVKKANFDSMQMSK